MRKPGPLCQGPVHSFARSSVAEWIMHAVRRTSIVRVAAVICLKNIFDKKNWNQHAN